MVEPDASRSADLDLDAAAAGEPALIALRGRAGNILAEAVVAAAPAAAAAVGNAVYVRQSGAERASLARGSVDLPGDLLGWLDRGIIDLPQSRIASLTLTGADGAVLAIRRDSPDAALAVTDLPEGARLKTDAGLSDLTGALAELAFDDVKPLALVELPENGLARARFATFDGLDDRSAPFRAGGRRLGRRHGLGYRRGRSREQCTQRQARTLDLCDPGCSVEAVADATGRSDGAGERLVNAR